MTIGYLLGRLGGWHNTPWNPKNKKLWVPHCASAMAATLHLGMIQTNRLWVGKSRTNHQKLHVDWSWYVLKLLGCSFFLKWWFLVAMLGFSRWVWWNRHVMTTWPIFFWHQPTFYFFEHQWWMQHCARFWLLHPGRLTWNLQITHLKRIMIFQASMTMFHINLPGCNVRQPMDALTYPFPREASQLHFQISSWITISLNGFWTRLDGHHVLF